MRVYLIGLACLLCSRIAAADPNPAQLYAIGQQAYDAGDYDTAISTWTRSYEQSHFVALLFNLAQAYRLRDHAGDCAQAVQEYRDFIAQMPAAPQRPIAEGFVHSLVCVREKPVAAAVDKPVVQIPLPAVQIPPPAIVATVLPASAPPVSQTKLVARVGAPLDKRFVGLGVAGAGAVSLVAGLALGHHGEVLGDAVTAACRVSCDWASYQTRDADGRRDVRAGWVLDGVGAAGVATGVVLYAIGVRDLHVEARLSGATVAWSRSW